jgi:hypothetical protein
VIAEGKAVWLAGFFEQARCPVPDPIRGGQLSPKEIPLRSARGQLPFFPGSANALTSVCGRQWLQLGHMGPAAWSLMSAGGEEGADFTQPVCES